MSHPDSDRLREQIKTFELEASTSCRRGVYLTLLIPIVWLFSRCDVVLMGVLIVFTAGVTLPLTHLFAGFMIDEKLQRFHRMRVNGAAGAPEVKKSQFERLYAARPRDWGIGGLIIWGIAGPLLFGGQLLVPDYYAEHSDAIGMIARLALFTTTSFALYLIVYFFLWRTRGRTLLLASGFDAEQIMIEEGQTSRRV